MKNCRIIVLFLAAILAFGSCSQHKTNYTVIVSLDAFRWDFPDMYSMPFVDSLAEVGVKARMEPSYPASTFPNHYTLATGLVPDHNGIVNNNFWNPVTQYSYSMKDSLTRYNPDYYLGEPVWATVQRQGEKAGVIYWVGSDIAVGGVYPTYYRNWDEDPHWDFPQRVDEAVRLLSLPKEERPRLLMVYFDEPDHTEHVYGPCSEEAGAMASHMDSLVHSLYLRLKALPEVGDKLNFIVTGDHGMTDVSPERFICIKDVIPERWLIRVSGNTPSSLWAAPGCVDSIYNALMDVRNISVWKHGEVPAYLNYGTSDRLGDIIVAPDLGWQFNWKPTRSLGAHGFDCKAEDMLVAFRAVGPDFKVAYEAPFTKGDPSAFHNVDIYPLLCHLLGVKPAPVDGNLKRIKKILK
ncbi:MAG: alkaline phosphatase family protein [Bacteroidales bacterium]|nr:alkaline phosphatase family protein [Bacteroidales bacterium]